MSRLQSIADILAANIAAGRNLTGDFGFNNELSFARQRELEAERQAQEQFDEDQRRFDVGQQNRTALLEQLGLATPGGPSSGFAEGTVFGDLLGPGSGPSQGFTDLLAEQRSSRDNLLGDVADFGNSQRAALDRNFTTAQNNAVANLESRGLGASSLTGSALSQVAADRSQAELELEDQLLGRRLDLEQGLNQGIFDTQTGQLERDNQRQLQGISTIGQIGSGLL